LKRFYSGAKCKLGIMISNKAGHLRRGLLVKTHADTLWDFSRAINPDNKIYVFVRL